MIQKSSEHQLTWRKCIADLEFMENMFHASFFIRFRLELVISGKSENHQPWDLAGKILRQICRKKNSELSKLDFNDTVIGQEFLQVVAHISHLLWFFVWKKRFEILERRLFFREDCHTTWNVCFLMVPIKASSYIPKTMKECNPAKTESSGFRSLVSVHKKCLYYSSGKKMICEPDLSTITSPLQKRIVPWVPSKKKKKWMEEFVGLEWTWKIPATSFPNRSTSLQPVVDQTEVWKNTDSF